VLAQAQKAGGATLRLFCCLLFLLFALPGTATSASTAHEALLGQLRQGGYVLMIRHAVAPGTFDPPGFRVEDCATQRNLSAVGRDEARRLGASFVRLKIPVSRVLSSEWCRCRDTAQLAFGAYETTTVLNSLRADSAAAPQQIEGMQRLGVAVRPGANLVLVTHNFNIQPFSGVMVPTSGVVVLRPGPKGGFEFVGTLEGLGSS